MRRYRITFYSDLPNDTGHMFHCCQGVIEIRSAKSKDRAVAAAKHRFARREAIEHWSLHARSIEIEEINSVSSL